MKKLMFLAAIAAAVLTGCTSDDAVLGQQNPVVADEATPVEFGVYTNTTRATVLDFDGVKASGIGLFAFEQGNAPLATYSKSNFQPNFMYNQLLEWDAQNSVWKYEPLKYWPNNPGAMVSFFAYAPYQPLFNKDDYTTTPETNTYVQDKKIVENDGTRLYLSYDHNGPCIEYNIPENPAKGIDLMWGADKNYATMHSSATEQTCPYDYGKQKITDNIELVMKHALSRLEFTVAVWTDEMNGTNPNNTKIADNTKIYVKQVNLKGQFPTKGTLHLYNGKWSSNNTDTKEVSLTKDMFTTIIQQGLDGTEGQSAKPLLNNGTNNFLMLIPKSQFLIEIVYDVETIDPANPKNNSTVTNTITSADSYTLEQGKAYTFDLRIGLTSVKFDVDSTEDWSDGGHKNVDLPDNFN